jgi:hypothetical protein
MYENPGSHMEPQDKTTMPSPAIEIRVEDLHKSFDDKHALDGLTLRSIAVR